MAAPRLLVRTVLAVLIAGYAVFAVAQPIEIPKREVPANLTPEMVPDGIKPFRFRAPSTKRGKMYINSWSFPDGGQMSRFHSCLDRGISPPFRVRHVPPTAKSMVLLAEDLDVPGPQNPTMTRVHWLVYNIPPEHDVIIEGMGGIYWGGIAFCCGFPFNAQFEAKRGKNDFGYNAWTAICPRNGRHRYRFTVFAIDRLLPDLNEPTWDVVKRAIAGHIIEQASMIGTFDVDEHPVAP